MKHISVISPEEIIPYMMTGAQVAALMPVNDMTVGEIDGLKASFCVISESEEPEETEEPERDPFDEESEEDPFVEEPEADEDDKLDDEVVQNIINAVGDAVEKAATAETVYEVPQLAEEAEETEEVEKPEKKKRGSYKKEIDDGKIRALREAGWTVKQIALDFHCDISTIYNHMKAMGIK